jgi:hypothetical protein
LNNTVITKPPLANETNETIETLCAIRAGASCFDGSPLFG